MEGQLSVPTDSESDPQIKLVLDNTRPISASELGALLSSLATDYKRVNRGQTLVVSRLETGSVIVWLNDLLTAATPYGETALHIAKAAKGLKNFAVALADLVKPPAPNHVQVPSGPVMKSARALLKVAVDSGSTVEFESVGPKGERFAFKVTPAEAGLRQEQLLTQTLHEVDSRPQLEHQIPEPPSLIADRLVRLTQSGPQGESVARAAIAEVVALIASTLRGRGLQSALSEVASVLEGRGLQDLAEIVRAEKNVRRDGGAQVQVKT